MKYVKNAPLTDEDSFIIDELTFMNSPSAGIRRTSWVALSYIAADLRDARLMGLRTRAAALHSVKPAHNWKPDNE